MEGRYQKTYAEKVVPEERVFNRIRRGDRIFIGTGCGEPQYLVSALLNYLEAHPKAAPDAEILQVWTFGLSFHLDEKLQRTFRCNLFFIADGVREAINRGLADYTPIFFSQVPELFRRRAVPIDVALVQTSPPDQHGYMSLGISVDITKAAAESATLVIAQTNAQMPRVHGDTFIHIDDVDFIIPHDEPLLEYEAKVSDDIAQRIGKYVSRLVRDGDTIQVGYGSVPNAILSNLAGKKHLGVHTELLTDGIVALLQAGVIDNTCKSINRGKTVASFCMGKKATYQFINENPAIEFRPIDYNNNPLVIAQHHNMVAIDSALEIDLTGQATVESIGKTFFSGIGGSADFMRGTILAPGGKTILALQSTAENGTVSRIVPILQEGAGATLNRGDIHYVVTEYGIAYLHGRNIRERAMELIAIAHPQFRPWLIEKAKDLSLIYRDQAFVAGEGGEYPEHLETYRTTRTGLELFLRPMKISDEPLLKDFFHYFSDQSIYRRFFTPRKDAPHEFLQRLVIVDYSQAMAIVATVEHEGREAIIGVGRYFIDKATHTGDLAFAVRDDYQGQGLGKELLSYIVYVAKRQGLLGFTAEVLAENRPMMEVFKLFEKWGYTVEKKLEEGVYYYKMT